MKVEFSEVVIEEAWDLMSNVSHIVPVEESKDVEFEIKPEKETKNEFISSVYYRYLNGPNFEK